MLIGRSTSQDSSTYQSPQHVAEMGPLSFLEIRRLEIYPRTVLE